MLKKFTIVLVAMFVFSMFIACAAGINVPSTASNGSLNIENGVVQYLRADGTLGASGNWSANVDGESYGSATIDYQVFYDTNGENPYEEIVKYEYEKVYFDGSYFALVAEGDGNSLEGTKWTTGLIKAYKGTMNVDEYLAMETKMTLEFSGGILTITYDVYKEYNEAGLVYDAVDDGDNVEKISYTVSGDAINLEYGPMADIVSAEERLVNSSIIDYSINEDKLFLYVLPVN